MTSNTIPLSISSPEYKGISELNIIYEAGLDNESRPILVLCANNLPNPDIYDYDLILSFLVARLDEFVENDYVLVFFSSPAKHRPGWMWLLKAYRLLDRKYKKNLKALYVVHLSTTYRIIFDLANKVISPKFASKLRYIPNLEVLQDHIQLAPQFIPLSVINYDSQLPSTIANTHQRQQQKRPVPSLAFGRKLEDLALLEGKDINDNDFIPAFIIQIINHIKEKGLDKEGIFRKSPSSGELQSVKYLFNYGKTVNLHEYDINVSASLLKVFIRELPIPLIDLKFSDSIAALLNTGTCTNDIISKVKDKLLIEYESKHIYFNLLKFICHFLKQVSDHANKNKMTIYNLAVVFTPNMIRTIHEDVHYMKIPDTQQSVIADSAFYLKQMNQGITLVQFFIVNCDEIFR
ncbi:Rho GTPase activation protein [Cokeromyces recurvatus]|uniref:Rho GTPase activation protein n=1 Tax=Cokeromyces recurvatus TaxID=90255 RepID=UPI00221FCB81|nr:Rho GTPase activation protein [Cokeromyces recurvatus]KAI7907368.1 Rho GTPase activation protein [Cokeromyces recurvatus]